MKGHFMSYLISNVIKIVLIALLMMQIVFAS